MISFEKYFRNALKESIPESTPKVKSAKPKNNRKHSLDWKLSGPAIKINPCGSESIAQVYEVDF
jgi:hypothetical protein